MSNWIKTFVLMAAITALFISIGDWIGGPGGAMIALTLACMTNFFSYWFSDRMILSLYRARIVKAQSAPQLYQIVSELAQKAQLPMPAVYWIEDSAPNAFATGRGPEHSALAVTRGLVERLTPRELRGVIAHELAHIKNRDILISTISATVAGAISGLAHLALFFGGRDEEGRPLNPLARLALVILAPLAAALIQMAISRAREFEADRTGARISGDPLALAQALAKIESAARNVPFAVAQDYPETAQMMIIHPSGIAQLFSTHPPTAERIARLQKLSLTMQTHWQ